MTPESRKVTHLTMLIPYDPTNLLAFFDFKKKATFKHMLTFKNCPVVVQPDNLIKGDFFFHISLEKKRK